MIRPSSPVSACVDGTGLQVLRRAGAVLCRHAFQRSVRQFGTSIDQQINGSADISLQ
jgi:hypothetical protein